MQIKTYGLIEKASKLSEGEIEFVVSTNDLDAHGERIDVEGIDFKDFKKNPVVLWGHEGWSLPIARATKIWKENNKLMAKALFDMSDDFAVKVYNKIKDGFLNAVSIGGMVEEWGADGITISRMNMKEFSVVSIPANPKALATAKSLSTEEQNEVSQLDALAKKRLQKLFSQKGNTISEIERLEKFVATLKEVALSEPHDDKKAEEYKTLTIKLAQTVDKQAEVVIKTIKLKGTQINE